MRTRSVNPRKIFVPDVRMTSEMDAEEYRELVDSIRAQGILTPIRATLEGDKLVLVDGLNRLHAAIELGLARVPVVLDEGDLAKNLVQNVVTNRMRGRSRPGELVAVVKALQDELGLEPDEIEERIGLSRGYLRSLLRIAQGSPELLEAVGARRIPLGVAVEISRVPGFADQGAVLAICEQGKFTVADAARAVDLYVANLARPAEERKAVEDLPLGKVHCNVGQHWVEPWDTAAPIVCKSCWGALLTLWGASVSGPAPAASQAVESRA